jgi:anionic cell wall polymer biosynthesis LytR-Cps2A-Psr (LCP) family protein
MRGTRAGTLILGKVGYVVVCLAAAIVLVVSGYAHGLLKDAAALEQGGASLGDSSSVGAMNILLMGLESRTDFEGNTLSAGQLTETHSGSDEPGGDLGAQDTDTLILIHIDAGGRKATGWSIPRDDVVNYPSAVGVDGVTITEGKVDAAYNDAYNQYIAKNDGTQSGDALYTGANQAGELFEVQTVESLTHVHIDHFVVSNIIGFYSIASELGGISVCIGSAPASIEPGGEGFTTGSNLIDLPAAGDPLSDSNSGFDAFEDGYNIKQGGNQYLHLGAAQSLAFVRARDSLPGVDIGRTHRQQAAIDYIIYDLKHRNILTDPSTIDNLLTASTSFIKTDSGFNLLDFAPQMESLTGSNLKLSTLPDAAVTGIDIPGLGDNQDANYVYVPDLAQEVNDSFYGSAAVTPSKSVTVDVFNGSGTDGLAGEASTAFADLGYSVGQAANASSQSQQVTADTQVFYGAGAQTQAAVIADDMGVQSATALSSVAAGHVEVLMGSDVIALPPGLEQFGADTVSAADFAQAAQQDGLAAGEQAPASATGTGLETEGTDSVSATVIGPHAVTGSAAEQAKVQAAAQSAASDELATVSEGAQLLAAMTSSSESVPSTATSSGEDNEPRPADAPASIPCVF